MSSQNSFPSRFAGRPAPRPVAQGSQPQWASPQPGHAPPPGHVPHQTGHPPQQAPAWTQVQAAADPRLQQPAQHPQYSNAPYGGQPPAASSAHAQWGEFGENLGGFAQPNAAAARTYAPQFEPYTPAARAPQPPQSFAARNTQWASPQGFAEPNFAPEPPAQRELHPARAQPVQQHYQDRGYHEPELSAADWHQPNPGDGQYAADPYQQQGAGAEIGFAQPVGGELDPGYGEEEDEDYELEDAAPRRRRPFMIIAALAGAIIVGGGLAYGFKKVTAGGNSGDPPLVKSDNGPTKMKPADAGGKQFPYADSKIMGRLGDGSASAAATSGAASPADAAAAADDNGSRKVSTLVVNRDGSIQAPTGVPAAAAAPAASGASNGSSGVPGMTLVDAFGSQRTNDSVASISPTSGASAAGAKPAFKKVVVLPPHAADDASDDAAPVKVTKINGSKSASQSVTGSIGERDEAAAPKHVKKKKLAKADTVATDADDSGSAPVTASHGSGFVAVLASVPRSSSSRMDALKRFADLQQQYGDALSGKTPDVSEANLGAKGSYHRLVAGPPGSRQEANAVCSKLKTAGYSSCWVMSY